MLLRTGHWLGKGSLLTETQSLGQALNCDVRIENDSEGITLKAELVTGPDGSIPLTVRVASNDVGTYVISVRSAAGTFMGTAKLDSEPNIGLVWNDNQTVVATFSVFPVSGGLGCRGFLRDTRTLYTWEIAFSLKQDVVKGDNVVSLRPRGRR